MRVFIVTIIALAHLAAPRPARAQRAADSADTRGLPLVEVPSHVDGTRLAILLSGDGGWASIDRDIADELASQGVAVVGLNLKSFLSKERTPDEVTSAVERMINVYGQRWNRSRVVIVGFSRGAGIAPFVAARLAAELRARVDLVALVGLPQTVNFKWHLQDVFRDVKRSNDVPVGVELDKLRGLHVLCVYGADEKESGCRGAPAEVRRIERAGGHHLDGDYRAVGEIVLHALER